MKDNHLMNILQVIPYFAPAWGYGGSLKIVWDTSCYLLSKHHKVTVYTTDATDSPHQRFKDRLVYLDGIKIRRFPNLSQKLAFREKIWFPLGFHQEINKDVKNYDVVCLYDFRTILNVFAYKACLKADTPFVLFAYGSLPRATGWKKFLKYIYDYLWGFSILKHATAVVSQTNHESQIYRMFSVAEDKIKLVPLALNLDEFNSISTYGVFRKKFAIKSSEKIILFLGRIHEYKGLQLIVNAFPNVLKKNKNVKLVVVGRDDGYLSNITSLVKRLKLEKNFIFAGALFGKERLVAYKDADIFVITPNHFEETPLAGLEALALGIPVIITKQAEIPFLESYQAGRVINYDSKELAENILDVLCDTSKRKKMSQQAKMLIRDKYSFDKIGSQIENLLSEVIK